MATEHSRPLGRPKKESQKTPLRQQILYTATQQFMLQGFKEVSMNLIAEKSNVTKATIYYYFDSKATLFTEMIVQLMERIRKMTEKILNDIQLSFKDRLVILVENHMKATADLEIQKFIRDAEPSLGDHNLRQVHQSEQQMNDVIRLAFEREMKLGTIPTQNSLFVLQTFLSLLNVGRYKDFNNKPLFPDHHLGAQKVIDFFWAGLFAK